MNEYEYTDEQFEKELADARKAAETADQNAAPVQAETEVVRADDPVSENKENEPERDEESLKRDFMASRAGKTADELLAELYEQNKSRNAMNAQKKSHAAEAAAAKERLAQIQTMMNAARERREKAILENQQGSISRAQELGDLLNTDNAQAMAILNARIEQIVEEQQISRFRQEEQAELDAYRVEQERASAALIPDYHETASQVAAWAIEQGIPYEALANSSAQERQILWNAWRYQAASARPQPQPAPQPAPAKPLSGMKPVAPTMSSSRGGAQKGSTLADLAAMSEKDMESLSDDELYAMMKAARG